METNGWFPSSTRNRMAMVMGVTSLIIHVIWNIMPDYTYVDYYPFGKFVWRECVEEVQSIHQAKNGINFALKKIAFIFLPLLLLLTVSIIPTRKIWQSSSLLRIIAGIMMLIGSIICIVYLFSSRDGHYFYQVRFVALNFLTTALAFLLFKNENAPQPDHGISST